MCSEWVPGAPDLHICEPERRVVSTWVSTWVSTVACIAHPTTRGSGCARGCAKESNGDAVRLRFLNGKRHKLSLYTESE